jgi:hypothetical protein
MLPLVILFVPETSFRRESRFDIDTMGNLVAADGRGLNMVDVTVEGPNATSGEYDAPRPKEKPLGTSSDLRPKISFLESLRLFNGRKSDERYLHLLLRPFPLFIHPGILWSCLIQGTLIGFTVLIGIVLAGIMLGPPLWFGEVETGYMYVRNFALPHYTLRLHFILTYCRYTGAFIGALLGFLLCGLISDPCASYLTRINNGVYEPEFRMVLVIPQLIFGGAGLIGFGWTSNDAQSYGWVWPDFFFGMVVVGMVCGAVGSALYIVDAHRTSFLLFRLRLMLKSSMGGPLLMAH